PAHVKRNCVFQIFQFATMSVRQTSETSKRHPKCQVAALDMRSRNVTGIGSAIFDAWDRSGNPACGTVPLRASDVMTGKQFNEHGVIGTSGEVFLNRRDVPAQSISRKLESALNSFAEVAHKFIGTHGLSFPDLKAENHFRNAIEGDPHVLISPLPRPIS